MGAYSFSLCVLRCTYLAVFVFLPWCNLQLKKLSKRLFYAKAASIPKRNSNFISSILTFQRNRNKLLQRRGATSAHYSFHSLSSPLACCFSSFCFHFFPVFFFFFSFCYFPRPAQYIQYIFYCVRLFLFTLCVYPRDSISGRTETERGGKNCRSGKTRGEIKRCQRSKHNKAGV
jgi:hypothetical protein